MKKRLFLITALIVIFSLTATAPNTFASGSDDSQIETRGKSDIEQS
ncbi:hypothetical protein [Shouchella miscanthi]|uniref:Uncharacterized protein n=1 Tax=Shouchella miscanthi TaxID=2598861 RepID=A0ABU6NJU4_9BACI|nr:hypothetical protein [Shouchella miscanthi]